MPETVILVDAADREVGILDKLEAHEQGRLHRALSIFIFGSDGRIMMQRRASSKYHSGGLWTNTCCSHPRPGEDTLAAAHRRLQEEMGFDCDLAEVHSFVYRAAFANGLTEHEFDHVFVGVCEIEPILNPEEAEDWKWMDIEELREDLKAHPENYTYWLGVSWDDVLRATGR